jgi:hypothetical protein
MSYTTRVTWANVLDKTDNTDLVTERDNKMLAMKASNQIIRIISDKSSATGSIEFNTLQDAEEWKTFIKGLAVKYNKTILSIVIE